MSMYDPANQKSQYIQKECRPGLYLIPTNSGVFQDPIFEVTYFRERPYRSLLEASQIPSWECVYFVRGGYLGAKCGNQGKPIKFQIYFIDGPALRSMQKPEQDGEFYSSCLNDVYPVFQIKHPDCIALSDDITEGCLQKIHEKEHEHYELHKVDFDPFSRIQQGLDIFCFLMDTLPLPIAATPLIEDPSQPLASGLIDLTLDSNSEEDTEMVGFDLIKRLLARTDLEQQL